MNAPSCTLHRFPALHLFPTLLAAILALTLCLTGCSGHSSDDSTGTPTPRAAVLTFSIAAGAYPSTQTVTIASDTPGVTIYYTTNSSAPTTASAVYSAPITISTSETVQAIAVTPGTGGAPSVTSSAYSATYTITPTAAAAPTFSPAAGTYTAPQTVTLATTTPGATIYYTTDGSAPTTTSTVYTTPITISTTQTLKALTTATNFTTSAPATATYTINLPAPPTAAAPTFSPAAGTYASAQTVTLASTTPGATIYYTTDGSTPTTSSTTYTTPITISTSQTLKAITTAPNFTTSTPASAAYTINLPSTQPAAAPTFSPPGFGYVGPQFIYISDSTPGATIYYTIDGSIPTTSSSIYTHSIFVTSSETLNAIAVAPNYSVSPVTSTFYTLNLPNPPDILLPPGTYNAPQTIALSDSTPGVSIFYTTDGTIPNLSSTPYTGPITVSHNEAIKAIAYENDWSSSISAAYYTISQPITVSSGGPYSGTIGTAVNFRGTAFDATFSGMPLSYNWDFGDGTTTSQTTTSTSLLVSHTYSTPGTYHATLTVSDSYPHTAIDIATTIIRPVLATGSDISGTVLAAGQPIIGARVYLLAANTTGYGSPSVSLLSTALTHTSDATGAYVLTDASGGFIIPAPFYSCSGSTQLYLYASGGNIFFSPANPGIGLLAAIGSCPTTDVQATVNEVTTVATAYSLSGFATDATHISSPSTPIALTGIANAFATTSNLAALSTGTALATVPAGNGSSSQATLNRIANGLDDCITANSLCSLLFASATSDGTSSGTPPSETATTAINKAHHPFNQIGSSSVPIGAVNLPDNASGDLTLVLSFGNGIFGSSGNSANSSPWSYSGIAIDGQGSIWTDNGASASKFSPLGKLIAPSTSGFFVGNTVQGGVQGHNIAIDPNNSVWILNSFTLSQLSSTGTIVSPLNGYPIDPNNVEPFLTQSDYTSLAVDATGQIWIQRSSGNVVQVSNSGALISPAAGYPAVPGFPSPSIVFGPGIAVDPSGNVHTEDVVLSSSGSIVSAAATPHVGAVGPTALDASGNEWIATSQAAYKITPSGVSSSYPLGASARSLLPAISDIAVDGTGNLWFANSNFTNYDPVTAFYSSLIELSPSGTILSPPSGGSAPEDSGGFARGKMFDPFHIAIDPSGNMWVAGAALYEIVGLAAPVVTPTSVAVQTNRIGTRP